MTAPVNGTDERLDVIAELLREILAQLRHANTPTVVDVSAQASAPKRTRKGPSTDALPRSKK